MQDNVTIDKSWDFLVQADNLDLTKVLSAFYLIQDSAEYENTVDNFFRLASYQFDLEGEEIARNILSFCYETINGVTYDQFIKDMAFAFNKDISNELNTKDTEVALLKTFKDNILKEATQKELEVINNLESQEAENNQYYEYLVLISKLLDIDFFTNNENDSFYNEHPLVSKCYRAVIQKSLRPISFFRWWLRYNIVNAKQKYPKERTRETLWMMLFKKVSILLKPFRSIFLIIMRIIGIFFALIILLVLLPFKLMIRRIVNEEKREFEHSQNIKLSLFRECTVLITTLVYLHNKSFGTGIKDCIAAIEERNLPKTLSKEMIDIALVARLYDDNYTSRAIGNFRRTTLHQILLDSKDKINYPEYMEPILTDDVKQTLDHLYRSIDPERNKYFERIHVPEDNSLRVLMVDYRFPFTPIYDNTNFLRRENDIYDVLNFWYLQLMGYDTEDICIDLKNGDTFDVIQIYDTDKIEKFKDHLSKNGKFIIVRTEAEINRETMLTAVSDLQHMLGRSFNKQAGYVDMIRAFENDKDKYKKNVEGLISCVEHVQRLVRYYDGDFLSTIRNAPKELFSVSDLVNDYVQQWKKFGNPIFELKASHEPIEIDNQVEINQDMFFTSLDAIMGNAERHGFLKEYNPRNKVEIHTDIVKFQSINMALISISNNGKPFADGFTIDEYIDKGRFSKNSGHMGLGGFHVFSLAKAHQGYLNIRRNDEWNVIIDIILPLKNQELNIIKEYNYDGYR